MLWLAVTGYKGVYCETIYLSDASAQRQVTSYPSRPWSLLSSHFVLMSAPAGGLSRAVHAPSGGAAQEHDGRLLTPKRVRLVSFWSRQVKLKARRGGVFDVACWRSIITRRRENNTKHIEKLIPRSSSLLRLQRKTVGHHEKLQNSYLMDFAERFVMLYFHWCKKYLDHLWSKSTYAQYFLENSIKCSLKVP